MLQTSDIDLSLFFFFQMRIAAFRLLHFWNNSPEELDFSPQSYQLLMWYSDRKSQS